MKKNAPRQGLARDVAELAPRELGGRGRGDARLPPRGHHLLEPFTRPFLIVFSARGTHWRLEHVGCALTPNTGKARFLVPCRSSPYSLGSPGCPCSSHGDRSRGG